MNNKVKSIILIVTFVIVATFVAVAIKNITDSPLPETSGTTEEPQGTGVFGYGDLWYPDGDYLVPVVDSWGIRLDMVSISVEFSVDGIVSISGKLTLFDALDVVSGGTNLTTIGASEILYGSSAGVFGAIASPTEDYVLTGVGGVPAWAAAAGATYTFNDPLSLVATAVSIDLASASGGGYLAGTDFADFYNHMGSTSEHLDWTADQGATDIHAGNYTDTDTTYTATAPLWLDGTAFDIEMASTGGDGYLRKTDWDLFTGKWDALGEITLNRGYIIRGSSGNVAEAFDLGASNSFCMSDGTDVIISDIGGIGVAGFSGFIDWEAASAGTIHTDNYIEGITYTANDPLWLSGTTFDIDYASSSAGGYILGRDFETLWGHQASGNEHLDWTQNVGTIDVGNYIENPFGAAIDVGEITLAQGVMIRGNTIGEAFALGASNSVLWSDGTDPVWNDLIIDGELIKDDTIDVDSLDWGAFTDLGESGAVTWGNLGAGELADNSILDADIDDDGNFAFTGAWDFGGGVIEITNSANPTVDAIGEIALDTTADQLVVYGSTGVEVFTASGAYAFGVGSASAGRLFDGYVLQNDITISSPSCTSGNVDGEIVIGDLYEVSIAGVQSEHINTASVSCDNNPTSFLLNDYTATKGSRYRFKIHSVNDACENTDQVVVTLGGATTRK